MTALLQIEDVTAGYTSDIDILRGVSVTVPPGSIRGLIGLNGAGKSTVMKTACGFLTPRRGRVRFDGEEITGIATHRLLRRGISLIPQESSLFPHLSVEDNLRLPLRAARRAGLSSDDALERTLERFPEIHGKLRADAGSLSGGQQKMVEFAKAHMLRPRLCLIDEPSIGLSPKIAGEVFGWIRQFADEGMAILLVDHNIRKVIELSDYTYVLTLGEVTAEGPRSQFEGDMHEQVREWLGLNF